MGTNPSSIDNFGTYLSEMRGSTLMEKILQRVRQGPVTIGILAKELEGSPQDVVSAVVKAEELGLVRLNKQGDETVVIPLTR
jgi:Mn-dependent DtxR family transcriptional regulator